MSGNFTKEQWAEIRRASQIQIAGAGIVSVSDAPKLLLPYQGLTVGLLESVSVLVIEKSRRIGLTWGLASAAVLTAAKAKSAGGMDAMYISYSQEMTREFVDACAMWARVFALAALEAEEELFPDQFVNEKTGELETNEIKAFRIRFSSGFEILALSSAPRSLRGKQGLVIIDEAAFVDSLKELLKAALAFLMWGGKVVVCSTHNGADNYFNELIQDVLAKRRPYRHVRIDLDDALKDGLYQRICLVRGTEWTVEGEAKWREELIDFYGESADEELFCIPAQGSGAWLPGPLIEARMTIPQRSPYAALAGANRIGDRPVGAPLLRLELPANYLHLTPLERRSLLSPFMTELDAVLRDFDTSARHAGGFDFARVADLSVKTLLAIEQDLRRREALAIEMRNVPGDEQIAIVGDVLAAAPRHIGSAFDATGMGWIVAEAMGRKFGLYDKEHNESGIIRAIKFSQDWYRYEMPPLKKLFEDDAISLIRDADHASDLRLVKVIRGIPMVPEVRVNEKAEGGKAGKKRHGDFAIALALAEYAARQDWVEYGYTAVPDPRRAAPAAEGGGRLKMTPEFDSDDLPARNWYDGPLGARLRGSV
jgi:phage FluMu gp28-like protein